MKDLIDKTKQFDKPLATIFTVMNKLAYTTIVIFVIAILAYTLLSILAKL